MSVAHFRVWLPICLAFTAACAAPTDSLVSGMTSKINCGDQTAQIQVGDTFLRVLCGCKEKDGATAFLGEAFTCTVVPNTAVTFLFVGTNTPKQIIPNDGVGQPENQIQPSQVYVPQDDTPLRAHGVVLKALGDYYFSDAFVKSQAGRLVVTAR